MRDRRRSSDASSDWGEKKVDVKKWAEKFEKARATREEEEDLEEESSESELSPDEVRPARRKGKKDQHQQRRKSRYDESEDDEDDLYSKPSKKKKAGSGIPAPVPPPAPPPPPPIGGAAQLQKKASKESFTSADTNSSSWASSEVAGLRHSSRSPLHKMEHREHHFVPGDAGKFHVPTITKGSMATTPHKAKNLSTVHLIPEEFFVR